MDFGKWNSSDSNKWALFGVLVVTFLGLLLLSSYPAEITHVFLYLILCVVTLGAIVFTWSENPKGPISVLGLGESRGRFLIAFGLGAAIYLVAIWFGLFKNATSFSLVSLTPLSALYAVVLAPIVEEAFFRGTLVPSIQTYLERELNFGKSTGLIAFFGAILLGAVFFGIMHLFAASVGTADVFSAFIFAIAACVGNAGLKSNGFGFGLHLFANFLWVLKIAGVIA